MQVINICYYLKAHQSSLQLSPYLPPTHIRTLIEFQMNDLPDRNWWIDNEVIKGAIKQWQELKGDVQERLLQQAIDGVPEVPFNTRGNHKRLSI